MKKRFAQSKKTPYLCTVKTEYKHKTDVPTGYHWRPINMKQKALLFITLLVSSFTIGIQAQTSITNFRLEHNVPNEGRQMLKASFSLQVTGRLGHTLKAYFNIINERDNFHVFPNGELMVASTNPLIPNYQTAIWDDLWLGIYNDYLNAAAGQHTYYARILVKDERTVEIWATSRLEPFTMTGSQQQPTYNIYDASAQNQMNMLNSMYQGAVESLNNTQFDFSNINWNSVPDNNYNSGNNYNSNNNNYNNSSDGTMVGSYQALGLIDGGSSRTDYFTVYKDNQGRYYVNLPSCSHNLMHSNTNSTYLGYNVSMYNYWFYDSYTRTYWYIRL